MRDGNGYEGRVRGAAPTNGAAGRPGCAALVEERRALLQQLRGYEQVATGIRMRVAQIERMMEDDPSRS